MNREVRLGSAAGLTIAATPSALLGSVALWGLLYAVATRLFRMPAWQAATGSLAAVALHWASVLAHHAGHAAAAWTTGHPMTGVRLFGVLGSSLYPSDEPALPASLHARRALGGPVASLAVGGVVSALWRPLGHGYPRAGGQSGPHSDRAAWSPTSKQSGPFSDRTLTRTVRRHPPRQLRPPR